MIYMNLGIKTWWIYLRSSNDACSPFSSRNRLNSSFADEVSCANFGRIALMFACGNNTGCASMYCIAYSSASIRTNECLNNNTLFPINKSLEIENKNDQLNQRHEKQSAINRDKMKDLSWMYLTRAVTFRVIFATKNPMITASVSSLRQRPTAVHERWVERLKALRANRCFS